MLGVFSRAASVVLFLGSVWGLADGRHVPTGCEYAAQAVAHVMSLLAGRRSGERRAGAAREEGAAV
jgi:hypothetical protein